jgi:hypothetical protein
MANGDETRYNTRVETNRWESFTRLAFSYFADPEYDVEQEFKLEEGSYELRFADEDRDEEVVFVYGGSPPDMTQEYLQQMQKLFEGSTELSKTWTDMLKRSDR